MTENLHNLIMSVPVIGVLLFFLNWFMKGYEEEKKINKKSQKEGEEILRGFKALLEDINRKLDRNERDK